VLLARRLHGPLLGGHVRASPTEHLAARPDGLSEHSRDLGVAHVEDLVQQEDGALRRCQPLQKQEKRHRDLVHELHRSPSSPVEVDRLRQAITAALFTPGPRRAELVQAKPRHRRQKKCLGGAHLGGVLVPAHPRLLHGVFCASDIAQHAIGEPQQRRTMRLEHVDVTHARRSS
jgi:hypothetical protein